MNLPGFVESIIPFVRPPHLKLQLNEQARPTSLSSTRSYRAASPSPRYGPSSASYSASHRSKTASYRPSPSPTSALRRYNPAHPDPDPNPSPDPNTLTLTLILTPSP
eukprot:scaffold103768_cov51-Phaeocystis_antarctica.AAC.1